MYSDHIAEFRKNTTPASFFVKENTIQEQKEWSEELLERTSFNESDLSICILDKGVNNGHPLISPVLDDADMHTTFTIVLYKIIARMVMGQEWLV